MIMVLIDKVFSFSMTLAALKLAVCAYDD
jgi:hypothetical protein